MEPIDLFDNNLFDKVNLNSMKMNMFQYAYEEFENIKGDNQNPLIQ